MSRAAVRSRIVHEAHLESPLVGGGAPWWDALPLDFWRRPETFALGAGDRARVAVTSASDVVMRTLGACVVGPLALPVGYHPVELARSFADLDFQVRRATGDRDVVFPAPPEGVHVARRAASAPLFRPDDGVAEDLVFESPFVPSLSRLRAGWTRHEQNRFAHARMWRHHHGPRPTVIAIHGFSADLYHVNEWFFSIPWLYAAGYDVLLATLPFHGRRAGPLSPFSGHGFFAGGPSHINEAFAQSVLDLRIFVSHVLGELGAPAVGVTGVSLGGFTTALLAATEPRLAFAVPNVPVVSIPDLVMEWQPIGSVIRAGLALSGRTLRDARRMLAPTCPLTWPPVISKERLFVIGGVGDRLAPPSHARLLWDHWGRPRLHWFPGSHLVHLDRGQYFKQLRLFLGDIGFAYG